MIIFGFLSQNLKTQTVAVAFSMAWKRAGVEDRGAEAGAQDNAVARDRLAAFRAELYRCLTRRGDALFELADAVLCGQGRVQMLAELSLEPGHQRGHGALYDALNCGSVQSAPRIGSDSERRAKNPTTNPMAKPGPT